MHGEPMIVSLSNVCIAFLQHVKIQIGILLIRVFRATSLGMFHIKNWKMRCTMLLLIPTTAWAIFLIV